MKRRRFLRVTAAGTALAVGAGFYTWRVEPHWLEMVKRRLPIANLPNSLVGLRLVQLSDLHIGPRVDDAYLIRSFDLVRDLSPDIVVYTGDFISYEVEVVAHIKRILWHLPRGRLGTFGILGNHDYGLGWSDAALAQEVAKLAEDFGVHMLRNEMAEVQGLQIIGLDDHWANRFDPVRAFANIDRDRAALVLSHNPDTADLAGWGSYSGWILAGHTHGGQCKPPFLPPPLLPVKNRRYTAGEFQLSGGRRMFISRGVGHLLKVRFNARPEIPVFGL